MGTVGSVLAGLVAVEHVYFMVLEMYFWNKPLGLKTFQRPQAEQDATFRLAKNQGLYNGFLAAGLFWSLLAPPTMALPLREFFLGCVVVAGAFGAATVNLRILFLQAAPAALGLVVTLLT